MGNSAEGRSRRTWGLRMELEPGAWGSSPRSKPEAWKFGRILMGLVGLVWDIRKPGAKVLRHGGLRTGRP